jgi:sortase A
VGGIGRILISLGVLMFAFVAYQLWGTGIQTAAAQRDLRSEFEQALQSTSTVVAPTTTTEPGATIPESTAPPTTVTVPPPPPGEPGEPLGFIEIPSIGVDKMVVNGVSVDDLKKGPGHFPESVLPGQIGNTSFAGHRTTHGAPFFRVDEIAPGDQIIVTTLAGRFVYIATETLVVNPNQFGEAVLDGVPDTATISLVSCHPRYTSRDRMVVRGVLDPTLSTPLVAATTTTLPPTTTAPSTTVPTTLPGDDTSVDTVPPPTTPPTTTPAPGVGEDAFSSGWFSDPDAWPQVALWGAVCSIIALAAWGLSRRTHRNWLGALVGIVPFVVALYYFYENVYRLLPPGI